MKIIMLQSDKRLGFKKGEIYEVEPYAYDAKLSAIRKVPDDGNFPGFNVYRESEGEEWDYYKE